MGRFALAVMAGRNMETVYVGRATTLGMNGVMGSAHVLLILV